MEKHPDYPPAIADLLREERLNPLGPGEPNRDAYPKLKGLTVEKAFGDTPVRDRDMAAACLAGLWLYHNFLEESHKISQDLDTAEGSYWHALMHRREPDASNSKYWWRRVGPHPLLDTLRSRAPALGYKYTTPEAFVDFCEGARDTGTDDERLAEAVQELEWRLLFEHCYRKATG